MSPTTDGAGVWLASPDSVSRWVGETIEQLATPIGIGSVMRIHPMANGQLWLVGAERMVRLGADDQPPPTYCADITTRIFRRTAPGVTTTTDSPSVESRRLRLV